MREEMKSRRRTAAAASGLPEGGSFAAVVSQRFAVSAKILIQHAETRPVLRGRIIGCTAIDDEQAAFAVRVEEGAGARLWSAPRR